MFEKKSLQFTIKQGNGTFNFATVVVTEGEVPEILHLTGDKHLIARRLRLMANLIENANTTPETK